MKSRRKYLASKKPVSKENKLSLTLAIISAAAFLFCVAASALSGGNGASYIGAVGLASALLALYGCIVGIRELASSDKTYRRSYVGAILGGVVFIIWLAVFLTGIKI
jgi:hypothetical protein